jgi:hypothetical protein
MQHGVMYEWEVKCEIELRIFSQSEKSQGHPQIPPRNSFHIEKPDTDTHVMKINRERSWICRASSGRVEMVEILSSSSASAPGPDGLGVRFAVTEWQRQYHPTTEVENEKERAGRDGWGINYASGLSEFGQV